MTMPGKIDIRKSLMSKNSKTKNASFEKKFFPLKRDYNTNNLYQKLSTVWIISPKADQWPEDNSLKHKDGVK